VKLKMNRKIVQRTVRNFLRVFTYVALMRSPSQRLNTRESRISRKGEKGKRALSPA